jgi:hypothetical protein
MSDIMYNDAPNWKELIQKYISHNDTEIKGFFNKYYWLSNFSPSKVWYEGQIYNNIECAYQAAKVLPEYRYEFMFCTAAESKKLWKKLPLLDASGNAWDARKYQVMSGLVFKKFLNNLDLRLKLLDTGNRYLEETLHWHENFYGVCVCPKCNRMGQNNLGKILMKTREYFK